MAQVGHSIPRVDGRSKATGEAQFPGDFNRDNQLAMKILFADRPHARVVAIDTRAAEDLEGVVAIPDGERRAEQCLWDDHP